MFLYKTARLERCNTIELREVPKAQVHQPDVETQSGARVMTSGMVKATEIDWVFL